jgi:hypothetical protein
MLPLRRNFAPHDLLPLMGKSGVDATIFLRSPLTAISSQRHRSNCGLLQRHRVDDWARRSVPGLKPKLCVWIALSNKASQYMSNDKGIFCV